MKKKLIIISLITISISVVVFSIIWVQNGGTDKRYQHDVDIVRLNHLTELATYIEEYQDKTGEYPLFQEVKFLHILILLQIIK